MRALIRTRDGWTSDLRSCSASGRPRRSTVRSAVRPVTSGEQSSAWRRPTGTARRSQQGQPRAARETEHEQRLRMINAARRCQIRGIPGAAARTAGSTPASAQHQRRGLAERHPVAVESLVMRSAIVGARGNLRPLFPTHWAARVRPNSRNGQPAGSHEHDRKPSFRHRFGGTCRPCAAPCTPAAELRTRTSFLTCGQGRRRVIRECRGGHERPCDQQRRSAGQATARQPRLPAAAWPATVPTPRARNAMGQRQSRRSSQQWRRGRTKPIHSRQLDALSNPRITRPHESRGCSAAQIGPIAAACQAAS